jgi:hypothetical protein
VHPDPVQHEGKPKPPPEVHPDPVQHE